MIPFANRTVTLYHKQKGSVQRSVIVGCSLSRRATRTLYDGVYALSEVSTCRMPVGTEVATEDLIVPDVCTDEAKNQIELSKLLSKHRASGAFLVQSVSRNDGAGYPIPHLAARGE